MLETLLSESFKQQQDLDAVRDDLGSLKFGFALLQNANSELAADSNRNSKWIKKALEAQNAKIDDLAECLETHKIDTTDKLCNLKTAVDNVQTTVNSVSLQVDDLNMCLGYAFCEA